MKLPRRTFLHLAAAAAALPAVSRIASAQTYPSQPLRVIVPFAPGGPTDIFARLVAQKLSERFGKQFYVENIGGAGGNVGMGQGAKAAHDGYTMLAVATTIVVNPTLYDRVQVPALEASLRHAPILLIRPPVVQSNSAILLPAEWRSHRPSLRAARLRNRMAP